jgi:glycerol-3-phosphate acyltransferase PlsY
MGTCNAAWVLLPAFAYLLGSVPWGLVVAWRYKAVDIRKSGSGNIGATNVRRIAGPVPGGLTLMADALKGVFPVYVAAVVCGPDPSGCNLFLALVAFSAFLGHLFPLFLKFKTGGKGVATALGCLIVLSPMAALVGVLVFVLVACWSNHVSAGSLAASAVVPPAVWVYTGSPVLVGYGVLTGLWIFWRHRENIHRLRTGTEPVIRGESKAKS